MYKEYELLLSEKEAVKIEYKLLHQKHQLLQKEIKLKEKSEAEPAEKAAENEPLKK